MIFKLASRNIWRNKRRTLINISAIAFAFFFVTAWTSIEEGAWGHILKNVIKYYYGYAQVHQNGYWEEQLLDKSMNHSAPELKTLAELEGIKTLVPRLESFALAANDSLTTGILLIGADPVKESQLTGLDERLISGKYFETDAKSVMIAEGIAERLKLNLNDSIILISQGYHGANAVGLYPIEGILRFASPELNKRMAYMPLKEAQWFFAAEGLVSSIVLDIDGEKVLPQVISAVRSKLDSSSYEVMEWRELIPELVEAQTLDQAGNVVFAFILYLIISFGIFGTILMMTKERAYEFGVLTAIGMSKWRLSSMIFLEILIVSFWGVILGATFSLPVIYWFKVNPIDLSVMGENAVKTYEKFGIEPILPASMDPSIFLNQGIVIFIISLLLASYPIFKIMKLNPVQSMAKT